MSEEITITKKEYNSLREDSDLLNALHAVGVDNWDGYSEALKMLREISEPDEESTA